MQMGMEKHTQNLYNRAKNIIKKNTTMAFHIEKCYVRQWSLFLQLILILV